jgi:drug/metabolite transporter (DMT)-like permease
MRLSTTTRGYLYVTAAALLWATSGTAAKALFERGLSPFELVQARVTVAAVVLGAAYGLFAPRLFKIRARDLAYFLLLGGAAMAGVQFTYFFAISKIQVAAAILLEYLAPILIALYGVLFWQERMTVLKTLALALAVAGCFLVAGGYSLALLSMNRLGIAGGLAAAVCFAGYSLLGERVMHRYPPWTVLFYALLFAALTWHLLYAPFHYMTAGFAAIEWAGIVYIAFLGTIAPFGLFFLGINHIRATRASVTACLEPISAGVLAFFLLGERLEVPQVLGAALVVGAVALMVLSREREERSPARIRAGRAGV